MRIDYEFLATLQLQAPPEQVRNRIVDKMRFFADQAEPFSFAKRLANKKAYRFRIGDYRVVCDIEQDTIVVLALFLRSASATTFIGTYKRLAAARLLSSSES